ncbi:reverse transcriptase domain-containing protein [Tanacetum coccineum]
MHSSVYTKLGLPALQSTRMTLELANCSLCVPKGIARDVLVPVGRLTFPADFVVVDFECDYRVPLILGRPFLRTARVLIDVHGEELVIRDGMERIVFKPDGSQDKESIHMMDIYDDTGHKKFGTGDDALFSTINEDKVFNPGILVDKNSKVHEQNVLPTRSSEMMIDLDLENFQVELKNDILNPKVLVFDPGFPDFGRFMVQICGRTKQCPQFSIDDLQSSLHKVGNLLSLSLSN